MTGLLFEYACKYIVVSRHAFFFEQPVFFQKRLAFP